MVAYIVRRLIQSLIVIILVTITVFAAMRLLPGDPIFMLVSSSQFEEYTEAELQNIREAAGLDKSMVVQYLDWMNGVVRGNLGKSVIHKTSVTDEILRRFPITAHIGILAFIVGIIVGIPIGIISAIKRGSWLDTILTSLANIGITVPIFWLGIMLIWLFSIELRWLPVMGYTSPMEDFWLNTRQLVMPVICMAIFPVAANARQARSAMLEVLRQDYIRTAWSKGLTEYMVVLKHALKNGLIPIITLAGMGIISIVGGTVLIEQVFNIPGMGRLAVDSIFLRDYPYVQGVTLVIAVVVVLANLLVDISYGWLDPRIRYN